MDDLTERQAAILAFIADHCRRSGYPPTVREIGLAVGLASPSTVHAHLAKLESGGHIRRDPSKPRAMDVCTVHDAAASAIDEAAAVPVSQHRDVADAERLPLLGQVAAGMPRLAEEHVEDRVVSPFPGDFMLTVVGDSMVDAGIFDGDLVVVRQAPTARDGQIVVARIDDEATVKTLRRRDGR
ncbi:MAG: transcriptional repressor LexA, partial [Miltoncostaeaceae bacterium]